MRVRAVAVTALLTALAVAGCRGTTGDGPDPDDPPFVTEGPCSTPRQPALNDVLPAFKAWAPARDGIQFSLGVFLPDIPGCDWDAASPDPSPVLIGDVELRLSMVERSEFLAIPLGDEDPRWEE